MEEQKQEDQKVKSSLSLTGQYLFGIVLLLAAFGAFSSFDNFISGILLLVAALVVLPPSSRKIEKNFKAKIPIGVKVIIAIILVVMAYNRPAADAPSKIQETAPTQIKSRTVTVPAKTKSLGKVFLNMCEVDSENADFWKEKNVNLFQNPPNIGEAVQVEACESLELELLEKKTIDGDEYYKVKHENKEGWQKSDFFTNLKSESVVVEEATTGPVTTIERSIKSIGDYEVTVWTEGSDFATDNSQPPFEVTINTSIGQITSCSEAKQALFDVMKGIYDNAALKGKVSRATFSAFGQLRASLGSSDATFSWLDSGPSNFWKVLLDYSPQENETGYLDTRTWGVNINNC